MYTVFVLLLFLHCFIFMLVLLLCCVYRSSLYCNIPSDLCTLCLSCYYFYIVLSLYLYCCYVMYTDHHFTVIYLQICVPCVCLVITSTLFYLYACTVACVCCYYFYIVSVARSRSSLYCNIPSDLCTLCLSCYYFYIVLSLYLYCCYVVYPDHHFTVIYLQTCVICVCLVITSTLFYLYTCTVVTFRLVYVYRSSLYCNIPSGLCTLCLSCYYFYIVLSLYLYCCYVMYTDHHFTVIYVQTCVVCVCLVITSTLFYLYTCTVDMLCI